MTCAPGANFPNPCPVCGDTDEHGAWRATVTGSPCTLCPHPAERGHGTGCCCAGLSSPLALLAGSPSSPFLAPGLEERVAALEAALTFACTSPPPRPLTEAETAGLKQQLAEVTQEPSAHRVIPQPPPLTPDEIRHLLRECVTVVKPGETLIIRGHDWAPRQLSEIQQAMDAMHETGRVPFRALAVPGDELGVTEEATGAA